jgi:hypothetical protein
MKQVTMCSRKTSLGFLPSGKTVQGPAVMMLVDVVDALQEVRDPADPALGQRDLDGPGTS